MFISGFGLTLWIAPAVLLALIGLVARNRR